MELINECLGKIRPVDEKLVEKAQAWLDRLTKPIGSLGLLELIARRMAALQNTATPEIARKTIVLMAGDHGVTNEGVSAYPRLLNSKTLPAHLRSCCLPSPALILLSALTARTVTSSSFRKSRV